MTLLETPPASTNGHAPSPVAHATQTNDSQSETATKTPEVSWPLELALVATSLALAYGFARVFVDLSFFNRLGAITLISHTVAIAVRRMDRGVIAATLTSIVGLGVATGLVFYRSTTTFGLPSWATRDAARVDLAAAWKLFTDVRTPVEVHPGFVLGACLAMWVVAFLADWAAFRMWSPIEALAPGAVVFVFCSLEAAPKDRMVSTMLFALAALIFLLLHRSARVGATATWLAVDPRRGQRSVIVVGAVIAVLVVATGAIVGPNLPGSDSEAAIPWRDFGKGDRSDTSRVTVSPLVTIRSRLVNQADEEAFTVKADQPDYWRLTSLDKFDGFAWTSSGTYQSTRNTLRSQLPEATPTATLVQTVTIAKLETPWLPAAFEPLRVQDDGGTQAIYDFESSTLTVGNKVPTAEGMTYIVESRVPTRDVATLRAATDLAVPEEILERYAVEPQLDSSVKRVAEMVTSNASGPFERALALQNYFRSGEFEYSLNVDVGHSSNSIEEFIQNKIGYCEQFSSAYAAMARHVGLPTRIAVGFTPGDRAEDGSWEVRGKYAHAWPEVYLAGAGWVRFEPTPGRGAPGDEAYTGVPFQQNAAGSSEGPTATVPTPSTVPGEAPVTPETPDVDPGLLDDPDLVDQGTSGLATSSTSSLWRTVIGTILAALALLGALVMAIPGIKALKAASRGRLVGTTPRGQVALAWERAMNSLSLIDMDIPTAATPAEVIVDARRQVPESARRPLADLAGITTAARYAPNEPDAETVSAANAAADGVRDSIRAHVSKGRRIKAALDPRPLLPQGLITNS